MGLFSNSDNYIILVPKTGRNKDKQYVYKESSKRWTLIRNFASKRKEQYKNYPYFCITGLNAEGKWEYCNYSLSPSSAELAVPEIIYDIINDKLYVFEGQLWELNNYQILDMDDPELYTEH